MKAPTINLKGLLPANFSELLESKGATFIRRTGEQNVRRIIVDVLCGNNLRTSTEQLTRLRLGKINAATFMVYLRGLQAAKDFTEQIPGLAFAALTERKRSQPEKALSKWMIGLTGKSVQNVLRDDNSELETYIASFAANLKNLAAEAEQSEGRLTCAVATKGGEVVLGWHDLLSLFCTIGSQTLAIRGSEKSTYGKLFERLVLGSVLVGLGFEQINPPSEACKIAKTSKVFWLSSRFGERESDAMLLAAPGQTICFDLGFIGRGNPEITKDKVSRFERNMEINRQKYQSATCIIVDRVGESSSLEDHARRVGAKIIQMSMSYWPKQLAQWLAQTFDYKSEILNCDEPGLCEFFEKKLATVSFENFVRGLVVSTEDVE